MPSKSLMILLLTIFLFASCAFIPEVTDELEYAQECDMVTKKLELTAKDMGKVLDHCDDPEVCLTLGLGVPIGSFVFSGSVVVIGNTLHWLEYQTTCDEGIVLQGYNMLK